MVRLRNVASRKVYSGSITVIHEETAGHTVDRPVFVYYDAESMAWIISSLQSTFPRTLLWVPEEVGN